MTVRRKQALGKGLGALLGGHTTPPLTKSFAATTEPTATTQIIDNNEVGELRHVPLARISPNPHQPRRHFEEEPLAELAASIRQHGVLQPILVTATSNGDYILLAGERRLRASELANKETIPARVITVTESERLELALIENVQREDLDAVEEARAYQALISSFGLSQEKIADRVGKSRVAIANSLRLLKLSENCLADLQSGALTPGHARAILMLHHPLQQEILRKEIVERNLTVRDAEERARRLATGESDTKSSKTNDSKPKDQKQLDLDVLALQEKLTLFLGCKVRIRPRRTGSGTIEIAYHNLDDFDRVLGLLGVHPDT